MLFALLASMFTPAHAACVENAGLAVRSELFLGRERAGVPYVGPRRWRRFLHEVVTPTRPGFTVLDAHGYWQDAPERSRVLVILHPPGDEPAIQAIAEAYRERFAQDAVYVVHTPVVTVVCAD